MQKFHLLRTLSAMLYAQAAAQPAQAGTPPSADLLAAWGDKHFTGIFTAASALAAPPFRMSEVMDLITAVVRAANDLKGLGVSGRTLEHVVPELVIWAVNAVLPPARRPVWLGLLLDPDTLRRLVKVLYKAAFPPEPVPAQPGAGAVIPPAAPAPLPGTVAPEYTATPPAGPVLDPRTGEPTT